MYSLQISRGGRFHPIQVKVDVYSSVVFVDENRTVTKPRFSREHVAANDAPAAGEELYLHPKHTVHGLARGTDHTALPHFTVIHHNEIPEDQEGSSWPDGRVFVAQTDYTDRERAGRKPGENVLDGLVYGISCGEGRVLFVFNAVDELVAALAGLAIAEPDLRALLWRLIPEPIEKWNDAKGLVAKAGVNDIVMDNLGLVIGIAAGGAGLLAILRTINDSPSMTMRKKVACPWGQSGTC
jgi:hypothetical protein